MGTLVSRVQADDPPPLPKAFIDGTGPDWVALGEDDFVNVNGEVRLWVNGEEVSGGTGCEPKTGYVCLESEGSPVEFKGVRIRELP